MDKIPNALPHRASNLELEIYGMEGIPPADAKEHEEARNRGKSSKKEDDEDDAGPSKKPKIDSQPNPQQPVMPPVQFQQQMGQMMGQPQGFMFPQQFNSFLHQQQMRLQQPGMGIPMPTPNFPRAPLFPAAAVSVSNSQQQPPNQIPPQMTQAAMQPGMPVTLQQQLLMQQQMAQQQALQQQQPPQSSVQEQEKKTIIPPGPTGSKIVHPPEDVSLVRNNLLCSTFMNKICVHLNFVYFLISLFRRKDEPDFRNINNVSSNRQHFPHLL